jgi:hypothetical protein
MGKINLVPTLKQELDITLETALMLAEPGTSIPVLADRLYDSERELIEKIQRPWIVERLTWLLYRKQRNIPVVGQLLLPGFPNLPRRMTLKDGRRPFLMQGNMKQVLEFRDVLLRRRRSTLVAIEKLLVLMAPYAKERPGITVVEVLTAEREKQQG